MTAVRAVLDRWRVDDEWWRTEISRAYYHVVLEGGQILTLFHDLVGGDWFVQTTATPIRKGEPVAVLVLREPQCVSESGVGRDVYGG